MKRSDLTAVEICAGAGGQALGLEEAGFKHELVVEIDHAACETLRYNRPQWPVVEGDIRSLNGREFRGIDLLAGGVPCPPFSVAGRQLGGADERDLVPTALKLIEESRPAAVMLENVPGFMSARFSMYRRRLAQRLERLGYTVAWEVLNASSFGVPQLRPRFILVAFRGHHANQFRWPRPSGSVVTVGDCLTDLMSLRGWPGATAWSAAAQDVAPTLVGGSKKHGGPDVGPTRAREAWRRLHVDGRGIADDSPSADFPPDGLPRLTVRMGARIQGFSDSWVFQGRKTASWRQVGNAFPPPVALSVGAAIRRALTGLADDESDDQMTMLLRRA